MGEEAVEQTAELVDGSQVDLDVEAVFTADAVAFADLGDLGGELRDSGKLARGGFDSDDRGQRVAELTRIEFGSIPGDRAC